MGLNLNMISIYKFHHCPTLLATPGLTVFKILHNTLAGRSVEERYWLRIAFLAHPPCSRRPHLMGSPFQYCHNVWYGKTRMVCLPDGEIN